MIPLESKDLSLLLSVSLLPLTFWPWEELDIFFRELPRELMLAGQLETFPGRAACRAVKSWLAVGARSAARGCPTLSHQQKIV